MQGRTENRAQIGKAFLHEAMSSSETRFMEVRKAADLPAPGRRLQECGVDRSFEREALTASSDRNNEIRVPDLDDEQECEYYVGACWLSQRYELPIMSILVFNDHPYCKEWRIQRPCDSDRTPGQNLQ